jgi:hypothetical protein
LVGYSTSCAEVQSASTMLGECAQTCPWRWKVAVFSHHSGALLGCQFCRAILAVYLPQSGLKRTTDANRVWYDSLFDQPPFDPARSTRRCKQNRPHTSGMEIHISVYEVAYLCLCYLSFLENNRSVVLRYISAFGEPLLNSCLIHQNLGLLGICFLSWD